MDEVYTSSSVGVIGLFGTGGIGKTTICQALCNHLRKNFHDDACHIELESVTEMEVLQKALKKSTEIRHDIVDKLDDLEQGHAYLKKKFCGQPVFLALDNVQDDSKSIEGAQAYLSANHGAGTIVMVIARHLDVLKKLNLDETQCLEMPDLQEDDARVLFLSHAHVPTENKVFDDLIGACIKQCHFLKRNGNSRHYHLLALKALGQPLGQKS